ncbi:hypothetical protein GQ53DRAFT_25119 [Thozetella sp. PMI_491]|nr:hypothetical protein GQ53DRAFT_25119 [Thozetella sp. PMI_491]
MAGSIQQGKFSPPVPDFKLVAERSIDLFLTPSNDHFYSRSPYQRLNSESEIRLLKVFPEATYKKYMSDYPGWPRYDIADDRRLLACELLDNVKMARAAEKYIAISYHAGSPRDTALILVNGIPFNAFANLEFAIRTVTSSWRAQHPRKELFLWTDQICINQNNLDERSAQVALMPKIYRRSLETNVCLATPASLPCLLWIPRVDQDIPRASSTISDGFHRQVNQLVANETAKNAYYKGIRAFVDRPWWRRAWVYQEFILSPRLYFLCHDARVPLDDVACAVDILVSNSERLFDSIVSAVAQEEEGAKRAHQERVMKYQQAVQQYRQRCHHEWEDAYQKQEINLKNEMKIWDAWEKERIERNAKGLCYKSHFRFQPALMETSEDRAEYLYENFRQALCVFHGEIDEKDVLESGAKDIIDRLRMKFHVPPDFSSYTPELDPPAESEPVYLSISEIKLRYISALQKKTNLLNISAVVSMIDAKKSYTDHSSLDFKELLRHSRGCDASDDRDRIYAFLGLANEAYTIKPDYSSGNTPVRVLIETARAIIMHDNDLSILADVDRGESKYSLYLPTWVPDWLGREHGTSIPAYISSIIPTSETRAIDASPMKVFHAEFQQHNDSYDVDMKVTGVFIDVLSAFCLPIKEAEGLQHLRTGKGTRVVASRTSRPEDQVWVLYGAKRPVILRVEGPDKYSFRGEACILLAEEPPTLSTVMFGEMIRLVEEGKAKETNIWLS